VRGLITDRGEWEAPLCWWRREMTQPLLERLESTCDCHGVSLGGILPKPPGMKGGGSACIDSVNTLYFRSDSGDKTLIEIFTVSGELIRQFSPAAFG